MKDIDNWKCLGFHFAKRFPGEYDLWVNGHTMQCLRRYTNGTEWITNTTTGEYEKVEEQ